MTKARIIEFPIIDWNSIPEVEGGCPKCGRVDEILNVERDHYCVCHRHKAKWFRGSNLFGFWRHEDEETWQTNGALLQGYRDVEPLFPKKTCQG